MYTKTSIPTRRNRAINNVTDSCIDNDVFSWLAPTTSVDYQSSRGDFVYYGCIAVSIIKARVQVHSVIYRCPAPDGSKVGHFKLLSPSICGLV